ncbi:uncharacterized protein LOC135957517 isoform X1 [Calliphora vicina]|uniref:uncharacterized protein LOC135957517 isoform X1 n=1 Tax=Calliphora vicina TaxID=7373 RepID=UPI00325B9D71
MGANKTSNLQKCGEILIDIKTKNRKNKTYIFHCTFCDIQCDQLKKFSLHLGEVHLNNAEDILNETELKFEAEPEEIRIQTLTEIENTDIKKDFGSSIENRKYVNPDPLDTVAPESSVSNNDILNCNIKCELKESSIDGSTIGENEEMYCGVDDIAKETKNEELEIFNTNSGDKSYVYDSDSEDEFKDDLDQMPLKKRKLNVVKKAKRLKQKSVKNEMSSDESKDADDNGNVARPKYLTNEVLEVILNVSDDEDFTDSDENNSPEENAESDESEADSDSEFNVKEQNEDVDALGVSSVDRTVDPLFVSKNGIVWNPQPVSDRTGRIWNENINNLRPGTTRYAMARIDDLKDAFMLFFPPPIENVILKWSNTYAKAEYGKHYIEIDSHLLHAFIGVLILAGVYRSKNETTLDLFDGVYGRPIFRAIMSKKTFQYMNRVIRFDDVMSSRQRSSTDKFAPIREIFDKWSELLSDYFNPSECVTIDKQLLGFRGRSKFKQSLPCKTERHGIKFWLLVCSETCYVWKIKPYLGKPVDGLAEKNQGERVVLDLVRGLHGHNITMDNFFSSYELGQKLLSQGLTMVGTMRKNKKSIPPKLLECKNVPLFQSTFAFTENTALVSYIDRKDNCVLLQSTMHVSNDVESDGKKLPKIMKYYNKTKGGADTVDKMLSCYSSKRKTNRWPMAVFANMIDISALNAMIIFKDVKPKWQTNKPTMRRIFLRELGISLAKSYMTMRKRAPRTELAASLLSGINNNSLNESVGEPSSSLAHSTSSLLREPPEFWEVSSRSFDIRAKSSISVPPNVEGKARCHICYSEKLKTKNYVHQMICCFCQKGICKRSHNRNVCVKCIEDKLI